MSPPPRTIIVAIERLTDSLTFHSDILIPDGGRLVSWTDCHTAMERGQPGTLPGTPPFTRYPTKSIMLAVAAECIDWPASMPTADRLVPPLSRPSCVAGPAPGRASLARRGAGRPPRFSFSLDTETQNSWRSDERPLRPRVTSRLDRRGFSRRDFGRLAAFLTAGAALPFYNEAALAQGLSAMPNLPPDAVKINANENPMGPCPEAAEAIHKVVSQGGRYLYNETFAFSAAHGRGRRSLQEIT